MTGVQTCALPICLVAKSADIIIVLDSKKIINTLIWQFATTPNLWKTSKKTTSDKEEVKLKDVFELPDYCMAFHCDRQPLNTWYAVLKIKDAEAFNKIILQNGFQKGINNIYISSKTTITFYKNDHKILVCSAQQQNNNLLKFTADEIFVKKNFLSNEIVEKIRTANSHFAMYISPNILTDKASVVKGNFTKNNIEFTTEITPLAKYQLNNTAFSYSDSAMLNCLFIQPPSSIFLLMSDSLKQKISTGINLDIDSFFIASNTSYSINVSDVKPRIDSAVSYAYDDNFNKIATTTANKINEPAFNFIIKGDSTKNIYSYLINNNKMENTPAGFLFLPMPLVKSYCKNVLDYEMKITSDNYVEITNNKRLQCIFLFRLLSTKIPAHLLNYLPDNLKKLIANIEYAEVILRNKNNIFKANLTIQKKKNDLLMVEF